MAKPKSLVSLALIICFLLTQTLSESKSPNGCIAKERTALLSLKKGFEDPHNRLKTWRGEDCRVWTGVVCSNTTGHVVKLDLGNTELDGYDEPDLDHALSGKLSSSLLDLGHLNYLDLSWNNFNDNQIPEFIGSMSSLRYLNLTRTEFGGGIPPQLGNLSNLQHLDLSWNYINSNDLSWLPHLSLLKHLDLSSVIISTVSNWTQIIAMLPSIQHLYLSNSMLQKPIFTPPLSNLSNLLTLDISSNFNGDVDLASLNWILNSTSLEYLDISENDMTGIIPGSFNNLCNIKTLHLSNSQINMDLTKFTHGLPRCLWPNLQYLDLIQTNLIGNLSSTLENLTGLNVLYLADNNLTGPIPRRIRTNKLTDLYLSFNSLDGIVSKNHFANCISLQFLALDGNSLLVDQNWNAPIALTYLQLDSNILGSKFPLWIKRLTNINELHISNTSIIDEVPNWFWNLLSYLTNLDMSNNQLSGKLNGVLQLPSLTYLYLDNNRFEGPIPELPENLIYLDLSNNHLSGKLNGVLQLSSLKKLYLDNNRFEGPIPELPENLIYMDLSNNRLSGKLNGVLQLSSLKNLYLDNNRFEGPIPELPENLIYLDLSNNHLSGKLNGVLQLSSLKNLYLDNNRFEGPIPELPENLTYLDLSNNSLSGTFPKKLGALNLQELFLRDNSLNGSFPAYICQMHLLQIIDLANNFLTGPVPRCWTDLNPSPSINKNLMILVLRNNSLSNTFPYFLEKYQNLYYLDLSYNNFSGNLPSWVGKNLSQLEFLLLRSNMFSSKVPVEITMLHHLQVLDLAQNLFSGTIPPSINALRAMTQKQITNYYDSDDNPELDLVTKGATRVYNRLSMLMSSIDLSSNSLTGEIPEEITSLTGLINLNLSGNHLSGNIPGTIGAMQSLESLDLSNNNLIGKIPSSLSNITSLSYLNMSHNNLSGRIPSGNQLQTFDNPSIYSGNTGLCGPPVSKNCPRDKIPIPQENGPGKEDTLHKEDVLHAISFDLGICIGFILGLWLVFCVILFGRYFRVAYFRAIDDLYDIIYVFVVLTWTRILRKIKVRDV